MVLNKKINKKQTFLHHFTNMGRATKPSHHRTDDSKQLAPHTYTRNTRGVTSMLSAFWELGFEFWQFGDWGLGIVFYEAMVSLRPTRSIHVTHTSSEHLILQVKMLEVRTNKNLIH